MDWNDAMGWKFPDFAAQYGIERLFNATTLMGALDAGEAVTEEGMAQPL